MIEAIIFDWIGTLYERGRGLFPCSEQILERLHKKYKLAVISKTVSDNIETRLKQINEIRHYFDIIIADTEKTAEQYIECIQKLKVKPKNTLVVDDRTNRGIQIGNRLGCQTAWIQEGEYAHETPNEETGEPTYRIKSIENLLEIL